MEVEVAQRQEQVEPVEPIRWYQALNIALARPSISQYQKLAANPNAKLRTALTWVGTASLLAVVGLIVVSLISYAQDYTKYGYTLSGSNLANSLKWGFGLGIAITITALIAFWLFVAVQHQYLDGRHSNLGQLAYVEAASFAPALFIGITLAPFLGVVSIISA